MIDRPYFISRMDSESPINLGVGVNAYKFATNVLNEGVVALRWIKDEKNVFYRPSDIVNSINAYPTPDMEHMIAIMFGVKKKSLSNAILINDDGIEIYTLDFPVRMAKEKWLPRQSIPLSHFHWCSWCDFPDCMEFVAAIGDTDWVEFRYWNYKTRLWDSEKYRSGRL